MFSMPANPMYNMAPTTPPGLQGIPYMLGPMVAGMTGGSYRPYVPQNMATFDATVASQVNNPLYKSMMGTMYSQLGQQIATTMGDLRFVQKMGGSAGYSPAEIKKALEGGADSFTRSTIGSFVMPFVDSGLNSMGLTGGSFTAATQAAFNGRMNLLGPNTLFSPFNAGQQHQAMAAAAATSTMLNNIMSQRNSMGAITMTADQQVTQGFSRERVTKLAMEAAGAGMFTSNAAFGFSDVASTGTGNLADRLQQAVGRKDFDLSQLELGNFDGNTGGALGEQDSDIAEKVGRIRNEVKRGVQGLTEAMGAMRDLTGAVDDELEKMLDIVTNGGWKRSANNAFATRDAIRTLHATSQTYNIDPKAALNQIISNRTMLQDAAGFDGSMLSMGFDGGGMFGLAAQTELFANIEDMVTARGVRGDPVLSGRIRRQGVQAMARNMNSVAGGGAQILAYARQIGAVSDEDADRFAASLTSGDSGLMESGLNRLLTTVFGSADVGRKFMNDTMQMNSMRMAMDDKAGKYAMALTVSGADAEFHRREQVTAAEQRLAFTQTALSESGLNTWQSADGAKKVVDNIVETIRGDGKDEGRVTDAAAFKNQFDAMIAKGMDPRTAASAVVSAYKRSPATSQYSQEIDLAVKRQSAVNNEETLMKGGLESRQATALMKELTSRGAVSGSESAEIYKMIRDGNGASALALVDRKVGGLDSATQQQMARVRQDAAKKHADALEAMESNKEAEDLVGLVSGRGWGGEDVAKAYETMAAAGIKYAKSDRDAEDYDAFWETVSKSKFASIFGEKALEEYMNAAENDKDHGLAYFQKMGRRAGSVRRVATSTLGNSGHGLQMMGYWGGGAYAGNSPEARKERDALIRNVASKMNEDAFEQAGDRDSIATRVVDFLTGDRTWKHMLSAYDPEDKMGLKSGFAKYGDAFQKFTSAQGTYNSTMQGYNSALTAFGKSGDFETIGAVKQIFDQSQKSGAGISIGFLTEKLGSAGTEDARNAVLAAAHARNAVVKAKGEADSAMAGAMQDPNLAKKMQGFFAWYDVDKKRNERLLGDTKVQEYIDSFDFAGTKVYTEAKNDKGARGDFLRMLFDSKKSGVTDKEIAAELGIERIAAGTRMNYGEAAMAVVKRKAEQGDLRALNVMKAARAAQRDEATRIHGTITIKDGKDSKPAEVEANLGGLGS